MADANSGFSLSLTSSRLSPVLDILKNMEVTVTAHQSSIAILKTKGSVRVSASIRIKEDKFFIETAKHKIGFKSQRLIQNSQATLTLLELTKTLEIFQ